MLLELLIKLQEADVKRDNLLKQKHEYIRVLNDKRALVKIEEAQTKLAQFEQAVEKARLDLKRKSDEVERLIQKQTEEEKKLYSKGISAREAEALQKDVEHLKERISQLQGEIDEGKEKVNKLEEKLESGRKLVENFERDFEVRIKETEEKLREVEAELASMDNEIAELRDRIFSLDSGALKIYDKLRQRYSGYVVCAVDRSTRACTGCYVELTPEAFEMLMKDEESVHVCDNCGRILVISR